MPTGTGRGGRGGDYGNNSGQQGGDSHGGGSGRGGGGGNQQGGGGGNRQDGSNTYDEQGNLIRVKIGVAWINGDKAGPYLGDMLTDQVYFRFSMDDFENIPDGWNIFGFPNKNKKGKAPDIDFVALPPKENSGRG